MKSYISISICLSFLITILFIFSSCSKNPGKPRILVFSKTAAFHHESIPNGNGAIRNLGSQNNFEVYTAGSGVQATEKLQGGLNPDVILMDLIMPEMNGFEMLEKINADKLSPDSTKIILSNKSEQADIDRGNTLGVAGYIVKANSTPVEVINQVISILNKKKTA